VQLTEFPDSLRRLVDKTPGANPEIVYRRTHSQGRLTASVHGSHVHVTVSLGALWARLMDFTPTDRQLDHFARLVRRTTSVCKLWCGIAFASALIFLAIEIGAAFLPGGAVERVLGGLHGR